jgi:hypothetical protein
MILVALLAGCGGKSSTGNSTVRLVNASNDYSSLDLFLDGTTTSSETVTYGNAGAYVGVVAGTHSAAAAVTGSTTSVATLSHAYGANVPVTLIAYGWSGALKLTALTDGQAAPASGFASMWVFNSGVDAGPVDVYLSGPTDPISAATGVAFNVAGGSSYTAGFQSVAKGTYRLRVTKAGDTSTVLMDVPSVTLADQQITTLVLTPTTGGALVGGLFVNQGGAVTPLTTTQARARVVSAVTSGATVSATWNGVTLANGATAPAIGSYSVVTAGSAAPTVAVNGVALAAPSSQTLPVGSDYTLLVWGSSAAPNLTWIADDNRVPTTTTAVKLRLVQAIADVSLPASGSVDFVPFAQGVSQGTASAYSTAVPSGTHQSVIAGVASNTNFFSYSPGAGFTLVPQGVYTVFMLGTAASPQGTLIKDR